jgi:hypothetical protein
VYIVYNNGPRMLPWGTPENIGNGSEVSLLYIVTKYLFCKYDFRRLKYTGGTVPQVVKVKEMLLSPFILLHTKGSFTLS